MQKRKLLFLILLVVLGGGGACIISRNYKNNSTAARPANTGNHKNDSTIKSSITVTDRNGNVYPTIHIGNQIWTAANFKGTLYNDGTPIPNIKDSNEWINLTTGAYCYYNNDPNKYADYGLLYNWFAVNTNKLPPIGWHIPTIKDLDILLQEDAKQGDKNNRVFSVLYTSGYYRDGDGIFGNRHNHGYFWSSTEVNSDLAWNLSLDYNGTGSMRIGGSKLLGIPIRFVRNN